MYPQEAKLQPKENYIVYKTKGADTSQQKDERDIVHGLSQANRKNKPIAKADKRKNSNVERNAKVLHNKRRKASKCNNKQSHVKWLSIR